MTSSPSQFRLLRCRLLLSYLGVMAAILGVSAIAVYQLFVSSLYRQLDDRLLTLAETAAQSFAEIKQQVHEAGEHQADSPQKHPQAETSKQEEENDNDGDLDIPLQNFRLDQGAEWFDQAGQLLTKRGRLFPADLTISSKHLGHGRTLTAEQIRTLTLTVYEQNDGNQQVLAGYVRVSESIATAEAVLSRVRWGLGLGGLMALGSTALGGMWLTRQSLRPIERSFRQLQQFTADASHELRSPLTVIKTSVEVMQSHPERIHPADVKKLGAVASATAQITHLVEDLLLLARMDTLTGQRHQEWIKVSLSDLLADLSDSFEIQAESQKILFKVELQPEIEVWGNPGQLVQLFSNLLQNALQYTPAAGTLTLRLVRKDQTALVMIEDTGIGIAAADLPFVFDRFWRADKARSHRAGGMGMGLAIAQSIAQAHGGVIAVSSQPQVGTCFRVRLPAKLRGKL